MPSMAAASRFISLAVIFFYHLEDCVKVEFVPICCSADKNNFSGCPDFLLFAEGAESFLSEDRLIGCLSNGASSSQVLK